MLLLFPLLLHWHFIQLQDMHMLKFKISPKLLECWICHSPLMSRTYGPPNSMHLCGAGHVFCGVCVRGHTNSCGASSFNRCHVLENIVPRIEVKCACGGYFRNCFNLKEHQLVCPSAKRSYTSARRKCRVKTELLCCSTCCVSVRPPVFRSRSGDLICSDCYRPGPDNKNYASCADLDYLLRDIIVKIPYPSFVFTVDRQKMPPSSSRKLCDKYESNIPPAGNSIIIGKTKGKAPSKDGKMDKNIVAGDLVESDDDSSDDIQPGTGKRVAETAVVTSAYNKKAKIAMPSGQKTGAKSA